MGAKAQGTPALAGRPLTSSDFQLGVVYRQVETRMVELSQLLGLFTGKLQDQQEDVVEIHEAAIGTTINVQKVSSSLSR